MRGDYTSTIAPHHERGKSIKSLIGEVLRDANITVHSVTHRVKTEQSAKEKIDRSPDKYGAYSDLHDLLGARVITHLVTEVSAVTTVLRREFDVDDARSLDKGEDLDDDEFGYRSFHLIAKLRDERAALPEWRSFAGIYFEIQVRSILQHAWAEIEHDLGYKSSAGVPREIRRRFARLAGLLEIADDEFDQLAVDAKEHARKATDAVKRGADVPVDRDSIHALVSADGPVHNADTAIAKQLGWSLAFPASPMYSSLRASEMQEVGLASVDEVLREMELKETLVIQLAVEWLQHDYPGEHGIQSDEDPYDSDQVSPGISLFYLYLHRRLIKENEAFHSAPGREDGFEDDDDRNVEFRNIHDRIFGDRSE